MKFFLLRRGQKLGPFPMDAADPMWAGGEMRAGDLVCLEGEQNWLPVSRFMEERVRGAQPAAAAPEGGEPANAGFAASPSKTSFLQAGKI
ncbi:MAG: domain 2, partial [Verrucomicrobiota bacterium]